MATIKKTLTEKNCATLAPGRYADGATNGLILDVGKRARAFRFTYRWGERMRWKSLGRFDQGMTLKDARMAVSEVRTLIDEGIDPDRPLGREVKVAQTVESNSGAITFSTAWAAYEEQHLAGKRNPRKEAQAVRRYALDTLGPRKLNSIKKTEAKALILDAVKRAGENENKRLANKGEPPTPTAGMYVGKQLQSRLRSFFNWCINDDIVVGRNPFEKLALELRTPSRDRTLSMDEIMTVLEALERVDSPVFVSLFLVILMTGMRRTEAASIRLGWVDWDGGFIALPDTLAKNKLQQCIALSDGAVVMLRQMEQQARDAGVNNLEDALAFTSDGVSVFTNWQRGMELLRAELPDDMPTFTIHDLRRTVATHCARLGAPEVVVEKGVLRHLPTGQRQLAATYQRHQYIDEARQWLNKYGAAVAQAAHGHEAMERHEADTARQVERYNNDPAYRAEIDAVPNMFAGLIKAVPNNGRPGVKLMYLDGVLDRGAVAVNPMFKRGYRTPRGTAH